MNDPDEQFTDLDEMERQHYVTARYVTLRDKVTGIEVQMHADAENAITIMKSVGYVVVEDDQKAE